MSCRYAINQDGKRRVGWDETSNASLGLHIIGDAVTCSLVDDEIKILLINLH